MINFKEEWDLLLLKFCTLSIILETTQSQSLRQTKFTSVKPSLSLAAGLLLMTFFSSLETMTQYSFALNSYVKFFSNIESASDLTYLFFSKLESNMSSMMSPKQGTAPLNQKSTFSTIVSYPLQGNNYSPLLG